ncbi:hypothetical protein ASPWEDRAFT_170297 [Aspergillus wentii DTO 134E9]|uniref:Ubiquitin-like domain-containing protein n=1 Tax=Aspergillus wentii DTO 134E9 TaxID=1073089 RepID=A0A1L9RPD2_ASPWE|nr:uncharacterized protein ASPWEDRAFT_170297 [Aspergillus wentii DTO 134E9]OJJ36784.1 hypothetical protein ASPWEDRAFT_170297 [Aspergillus wentii DTO 134E9]
MTFSITIDPTDPDSDNSSLTDEEDSSSGTGVQVSAPSDSGSHDYQDPYDEWAHLPYPDELKPSDSASRPRTSHRSRYPIHGSRSTSGRRYSSRRHIIPERESFSRRPRRHPSPDSPESVDSAEEYSGLYGRAPHDRRFWPPVAHASGYANSSSSGPSHVYPHSSVQHGALGHPNGSHPPSDQLIRFGHHTQLGQPTPYGHSLYSYGSQFQHPHGASMPPFFVHDHHPANIPNHNVHYSHSSSHGRGEGHSQPQQQMQHSVSPHGPSPYGGPPLSSQDLVPYSPAGYYPFRDSYPMIPGMIPPSYFGSYPRPPSPPSQVESSPSPAPPPTDTAKDEAIARLEKLIMEERSEREAREAREAARQAEIQQEAAEQAAREERAAHEKQIAEEAAALARAEAEQKAAEEAAKAKQEAEEAAAAAAAEAAAAATEAANAAAAEAAAAATEAANAATAEAVAAATAAAANPPPPEKKKPIKFKDAVGRKFSFPFDLCCTWQGMEELIRQAFLHIEVIGPHVAEGHYDLIGPNGDIILPQVWETVIEPDWTITMHMWPIPEKPKTPEPPPTPSPEAPAAPEVAGTSETPGAAEPSEASPAPEGEGVTSEEPKRKPDSAGMYILKITIPAQVVCVKDS